MVLQLAMFNDFKPYKCIYFMSFNAQVFGKRGFSIIKNKVEIIHYVKSWDLVLMFGIY